jgi:hypothetical protein
MGMAGLAEVTRPGLLDLLFSQHPDLPRHFSLFLSPEELGTSELRVGGYDLSRVGPNASFVYAPLAQARQTGGEGYWAVDLPSCRLTARDEDRPGKGAVSGLGGA